MNNPSKRLCFTCTGYYVEVNRSAVSSINVKWNLTDWEVDDFDEMLQILESQQVSTSEDQIVWKLEKMEIFLLLHIITLCQKRMLLAEMVFWLNSFGRQKLHCVFHLGGLLGKNINHGQAEKQGLGFSEWLLTLFKG